MENKIEDKLENRLNKAEKLSNKINAITSSFAAKLHNTEDLMVEAEEIDAESVEVIDNVKANKIDNFDTKLLPQILNLENMMTDVSLIRNTLKENLDLGKRLLYTISQELEFEPNAELLASYSTLSQSITENLRLFLQCYRDISGILMTISRLSKDEKTINTVNVNNFNIDKDISAKSTAEIIKQLSKS